jgi:CHASE3 domain sensor protein
MTNYTSVRCRTDPARPRVFCPGHGKMVLCNARNLVIGRVQIAFGSAILTLIVVGAVSVSARWARHTHEVIENLQGLLLAMADLNSGSGGFAMSGNESYLATYAASLASVRQGRNR